MKSTGSCIAISSQPTSCGAGTATGHSSTWEWAVARTSQRSRQQVRTIGPGTPGYLAPEQLQAAKGHELDWRADQFAIGIVAYEQLTGRLPFDPNRASYRTLLTTGTIAAWDRTFLLPHKNSSSGCCIPNRTSGSVLGVRQPRWGRRKSADADCPGRASNVDAGGRGHRCWICVGNHLEPGRSCEGSPRRAHPRGAFRGNVQAIDPQLYVARLLDANPKRLADHDLFSVPLRARDLSAQRLPGVVSTVLEFQAGHDELTHLISPTVAFSSMGDRSAQTTLDLADASATWWDSTAMPTIADFPCA